MEGDEKKPWMYLDPRRISVPVVAVIALVGWGWSVVNNQNTKEFQINSAILLLQQQNIQQDSGISQLQDNVKDLNIITSKIEDDTQKIQIEIADRLSSIETALGIKKKQ